MRRALSAAAALAALVALVSGCTVSSPAPTATPTPHSSAARAPAFTNPDTAGPDFALVVPSASGVSSVKGDDWTMPGWVRPTANSGFFSEDATPKDRVYTRSVDVSWKQIQPTENGPIDLTATGTAEGMSFDSLKNQLAVKGPFWMRIFASGEQWAPAWVQKDCHVKTYGPDYEGQKHLPIWNECVWGHLLDTYRALFVTAKLAQNPDFRFIYVPGAFTYAEFDYDIIASAVQTGDLDWAKYSSWYSHAWTDLAKLFGDNADKLVFTGEDYPFGPFGAKENLLAAKAVAAGLGIRDGITEDSNFHLNEAPAYGSSIQPNGHLVVDENLPLHDGTRVVATENECFNDCGYKTNDPYYAVRQANLKALQLRMNWMYLVPGPSYLAQYPEQWDWLRLSLGKTAATSPDAWADLRDAEDTYWANNGLGRFVDKSAWTTRPYVRNLERWLVQVDVVGSVAHRTAVDVHKNVLDTDNGTAYEGLSTAVAKGDTGLAFTLDKKFVTSGQLVAKVTYLDRGTGSFTVDTGAGSSAAIKRTGSGQWRTATVLLPKVAGGAGWDIRVSLAPGATDLAVRFVRVIRVAA